jgi:hypothetical protein
MKKFNHDAFAKVLGVTITLFILISLTSCASTGKKADDKSDNSITTRIGNIKGISEVIGCVFGGCDPKSDENNQKQ